MLRADIFEALGVVGGGRTHAPEEFFVALLQKRRRRRSLEQDLQLIPFGRGEEPIKGRHIGARGTRLAHEGAEKGAPIVRPSRIRAAPIGNEGARHLVDVVGVFELRK